MRVVSTFPDLQEALKRGKASSADVSPNSAWKDYARIGAAPFCAVCILTDFHSDAPHAPSNHGRPSPPNQLTAVVKHCAFHHSIPIGSWLWCPSTGGNSAAAYQALAREVRLAVSRQPTSVFPACRALLLERGARPYFY